jgi:hypothetical protein
VSSTLQAKASQVGEVPNRDFARNTERINELCCAWIAWLRKHPHAGDSDDLVDVGRTQQNPGHVNVRRP